jgi:rare lipoprotein A (peptidoglycan hydrolase)
MLAVWLLSAGTVFGGDTQHSAQAIAKKVEKQAERSEKKEGIHDLIQDTVRIKTTAAGEKVVEQVGEASFYGRDLRGKATASGKKFNSRELTAAHPTLPLGTKATVTNLETGKAVKVRITDRGPYGQGARSRLVENCGQEAGSHEKRRRGTGQN